MCVFFYRKFLTYGGHVVVDYQFYCVPKLCRHNRVHSNGEQEPAHYRLPHRCNGNIYNLGIQYIHQLFDDFSIGHTTRLSWDDDNLWSNLRHRCPLGFHSSYFVLNLSIGFRIVLLLVHHFTFYFTFPGYRDKRGNLFLYD